MSQLPLAPLDEAHTKKSVPLDIRHPAAAGRLAWLELRHAGFELAIDSFIGSTYDLDEALGLVKHSEIPGLSGDP
ncbi:MAG TPA: hypothetical protein PKD86_09040 [Gemmatales bacterium]|nr:hypothetical protein [Gemmatales bacterium]HMP59483.1 hypothetical protein [Gemmatales bacterium]